MSSLTSPGALPRPGGRRVVAPGTKDEAGPTWLGGGVQEAAKGVADVMVGSGNLDKALDDYAPFVDASFLN